MPKERRKHHGNCNNNWAVCDSIRDKSDNDRNAANYITEDQERSLYYRNSGNNNFNNSFQNGNT
jgi:hypothetical protein